MFQRFKALSRLKKIGIGIAAITLIGIIGNANQPKANLNVQNTNANGVLGTQTTNDKPTSKAPVVTTKTETETKPIPFESTTLNTSSLAKGITKITTIGADGVSTLTYKVTYTNGEQTAKELISQVTTTPPITQVTSVGTYVAPPQPVCPNGTYVNSVGNTVCSPYVSNSAPAGATAQCVDGTYSFSQTHSGTCSHHGGVSAWL
jgi:hypothetical protein